MGSRVMLMGSIVGALCCLLLAVGCGESDGIVPLPDFDVGVDAGGDAGFEKQGSAGSWDDPREELSEQPYKGEGLILRRHIGARPHMHANSSDSEYWLYDDEPAVFDVAMRVDGTDGPVDFDVFVFVDFELVNFAHIPVANDPQDGPLPSLEQASHAEASEASASFEAEPGVPRAFSLMIPPESLGDAAAHDVRIVMAARPSPSSEEPVLWPMSTTKKAVINFGATEFAEAPTLDNEVISPPAHIAPLIGGTGVFVEPPRELHDLADVEEFRTEARTAQLFETQADSVRLSGWAQSSSDSAGSVYLAAMVDTELLRQPSGQIMLPKPVSRYDRDSYPRYAAELDLEISLDDDTTRVIRLISFERPFARQAHSRAAVSNAIFIRKISE